MLDCFYRRHSEKWCAINFCFKSQMIFKGSPIEMSYTTPPPSSPRVAKTKKEMPGRSNDDEKKTPPQRRFFVWCYCCWSQSQSNRVKPRRSHRASQSNWMSLDTSSRDLVDDHSFILRVTVRVYNNYPTAANHLQRVPNITRRDVSNTDLH